MIQIELATDLLKRNLELLTMTLVDFSDADMLVRPCPGANHAAWQLGHLIVGEVHMAGPLKPGALPALPAGFAERFTKQTSSKDDAGFFPGKAALLEWFTRVREASIAVVRSLAPADLAKPSPESIAGYCPTHGHIVDMLGGHVAMHVGQLQVIRRRLGKPLLF